MSPRQRILLWLLTISMLSLALGLAISADAQEPIGLFPDNPELAPGFVRLCVEPPSYQPGGAGPSVPPWPERYRGLRSPDCLISNRGFRSVVLSSRKCSTET
jgi:hypothetical protein